MKKWRVLLQPSHFQEPRFHDFFTYEDAHNQFKVFKKLFEKTVMKLDVQILNIEPYTPYYLRTDV